MAPDTIKRRLGPFALSLQGNGPLTQDVVKFNDTIFDRPVETLEPLFCVAYRALKCQEAIVRRSALRSLPIRKRPQKIGETVGHEDALLEMGKNNLDGWSSSSPNRC